jgi:HK97 family phage portal protein
MPVTAQAGSAGSGAPPAAPRDTTQPFPPFGAAWNLYGPLASTPENFATVAACVQAIAGSIASLPARVYRLTDDGRRIAAPDHPVSRLIRAPNDLQTWADWIEGWVASMLLFGNGLSVVVRDGNGQPRAVFPLPWFACQPILIPASGGGDDLAAPIVPNSRLVFDITWTMSPYPLPIRPAGFPVRYFAEEMLFLRDRSDNGILGRSRLSRSPDALACALGGQSFSTGLWANGAMLNGVLKHPGRLGKEASDNLAASWRDTHTGGGNAGRMAILEEGMSYERMGVSPEDSQLLESRQFSVIEICRLFGVPPSIVGDTSNASFASAQQADVWFATHTLLPVINKIIREFSRSVFNTDEFVLSIDLGERLRGDYATMMNVNIAAVRSGVMSADEARREAGLDPRGGDADRLQPQAVGGRPGGVGDGQGHATPPPESMNGSGRRPNGAAA